jgi:hypothetical protein
MGTGTTYNGRLIGAFHRDLRMERPSLHSTCAVKSKLNRGNSSRSERSDSHKESASRTG